MSWGKNLKTNLENKYQFNGIDWVGDFGLEWSMATYRSYDGSGSTWLSVDPKTEYLYSYSPYLHALNSPIMYNDPDGDIAPLVWAAIAFGGGALNVWNNWDHISNGGGWSAGLKAFGVGAVAGVVGTAVAPVAAVGGSFGATVGSFAAAGAVGGGVGGAIEGFGNSLFFGDGNILDHLGQGVIHGAIGTAGGAVLGSIIGAGAYAFKPSIGSVAPTKIGPPGDDVATGVVDDLSTTGLGPPVGNIDDGFKFSGEMTIRAYRPGTFSINDWTGYPSGISKPSGPFRLLQGEELRIAQRLKKNANARLSRELGLKGSGYEIHEIQPIKFGGSPTDISNKMLLRAGVHRGKVTPWWNALQRALEKTP